MIMPLSRDYTYRHLLVFCALGGAIFILAPAERRTIELTSHTVGTLKAAEAARGDRPLDAAKAREIEMRAIEDELLYREALRMSLDRGDPIVRQRLIQKLLLLVEDLGGASQRPSDADLRQYFQAHQAAWQRPERVRFIHVFARTEARLPAAAALDPSAETPPPLGDAFPLSRDVVATPTEVRRAYGASFADALAHSDGAWSGPISSSLGWHRVRVLERVPGGPARFEEVRAQLVTDFVLQRRAEIVGTYLKRLAATYSIRLDGRSVTDYVPTPRVAVRVDPSAED
jgi:hypothetical protein